MKKIFLYIFIIIITIYIFYILYKNYKNNNNLEKFTQNDMCYADISKWIKVNDNDISGLEKKNIVDADNEDYILNDENNTEIINIFQQRNSNDMPKYSLNINSELKKKFKDDIPYDIYVDSGTGTAKYKPSINLWRINFIKILSEYLSKIKLGTKWLATDTLDENYKHRLDEEKLQLFINEIKSKNPQPELPPDHDQTDNPYNVSFNISSSELETYRENNLYTVNDIQEDSYFYDSTNKIYYHVDLGNCNKDDIDMINNKIKNKLRESLEELKNKLGLVINIDNSLLDKILDNFSLDTIKIELNNETINEVQFYNIYKNILDGLYNLLDQLDDSGDNKYCIFKNIVQKILDIVLIDKKFIAGLIKKNINQYNILRFNIINLENSDNKVVNLMDKIRSDLQRESRNSCNYKELNDGLINLISSFQENETSTVYDPSFILIDNINELNDTELPLLYYDDNNTISPECRNYTTPSNNPYKYIKDNITEDKCYNNIFDVYNKNGKTASDENIKQHINNIINHQEINSYYTQHLDKIKSKDASNDLNNKFSIKNYDCMINFLENNTSNYNLECHDENKNGENVRQDSIIKDTDFIPSKYLIDEILPSYIYYLKSHIFDISEENTCLYYYDSTDESSRVTMNKREALPDLTSEPLTDFIELNLQHDNVIDYGKIGTEIGKFGQIGTEKGKYGLIGNGNDYDTYITNQQCNNIVTKIIDNINTIKDEENGKISSISIDSDYITNLKEDYLTKIQIIEQEISNNNTYFSTTRPYQEYSNIVFRKETDANKINNGNYIDITTLLRYKIDLEKIDGEIENYKTENCPNNKPNQCREITIDTDITNNNNKTTFDLYDFYINTIKEDHNNQINIVIGDYIHVQGRDIYYEITNIYNDYSVNFQNDFTDFPQEKTYSFDEWIQKNIIITDLTKDYYFIVKDGQTDIYYVLNIDRNNEQTSSPKQENLLYQYVNQYNNDTTLAYLTDTEKCIGTEFTRSDGRIKSENQCTTSGAECKEFGYRYTEDNLNNIANLNNNKDTWINNNFITDYNEIYKLSTGQNKPKDVLSKNDANYWRNKYKSAEECLTDSEGIKMIDDDGNYYVNPDYNYGLKWYYLTDNINNLPQGSIIINISNMDRIFNPIYSDDYEIDLRDSQEVVNFVDRNGDYIQMDVIDENYYLEIEFDSDTLRYYKVNGSNKCLSTQICSNKSNIDYSDEYNSHINRIITDDGYCDTLNQNYGNGGNSHYQPNDIQKTCYHLNQNTNYNSLTYHPGNYDTNYTLNPQ